MSNFMYYNLRSNGETCWLEVSSTERYTKFKRMKVNTKIAKHHV